PRLAQPGRRLGRAGCGGAAHAGGLLPRRVAAVVAPRVRRAGRLRVRGRRRGIVCQGVAMNIGLIAMSGIRACDAGPLALGLTLPGFVERSKTIASLPSLGLLTLAGMTPRHHDVRYIEVADLKDAGTLPSDFDLVAISSFSAQVNEGYALAKRYRAMG